MFRFNHHHQGAYYLSFAKVADCFSNSNSSKVHIARSLMLVIKTKYVGAILM